MKRSACFSRVDHQQLSSPLLKVLLGLMIALAAILSTLQVALLVKQALVAAFIVSGYGFAFALTVGPLVGARGLSFKGSISAKVVYAGNVIGAGGSLIGTFILLYAAFVSL